MSKLTISRNMTSKEASMLVTNGYALSSSDGLNYIENGYAKIELTRHQLSKIKAAINRVLFENKMKISRQELISANKSEKEAEKRAVVSGVTLSKTVALTMVIEKGYEWSKNHSNITNGNLTFFVS